MDYQIFFGTLLVASGGAALACGLYAVNGMLKSQINRILLLICSALLVWSFGLAVTVMAATEQICSIGHRLAPIGWGPMSGLLLHFTLLLTGKERLFKKWWLYLTLYLPGLLMIFAFTLLPSLGQNTDSYIHTVFGWSPIVRNDGWDYFFYAYYIGFTLVNLSVLLATGIKSQDKKERAQVMLMAAAFILAYTLGTLTDVVAGQLNIIIPRLSPVFALLPIGAMVYTARKHRPLSRKIIKQSEIILNETSRKNIYNLMGSIFLLGGIINIFTQSIMYRESNLPSVEIFSLFLLLVAGLIFIVNRTRFNDEFEELLIALIYSFAIPSIVLRFVQYGSITIWPFALLIMVICQLHNRRTVLIIAITTSIMSQLLVWAKLPAVLVEVNEADYIVRLIFTAIMAVLFIYVNNIYIARLKENSVYGKGQRLLTDLSRDFISVDEQNMDDKIYHLLEQCGKFIGCERAYLILLEKDLKSISYSCEWLAEEAQSRLEDFKNLDSTFLQKLLKKFETEEVVELPDAKLLPPMAGKFKKMLAEQNIRALINVPIKDNDKLLGFIGFNSSKPLKEWGLDTPDFVMIISNIISDALTKIEKEKRINFFAYHDQLTHLPNRILFNDRLEQAINQAKRTKKMVAVVFLDLDSFKSVNDTLGHDFGDMLLIEVARILSGSIRNYDAVSRVGGDEFIIMINQLSSTEALINTMDKLMDVINKPIILQGQEFFITASAGVAIYPQDGEDSNSLVKNADTAMYKAKETGKNRYLMCSKDMKDQILERVKLTNKLYRALEKQQLLLYYQPQINSETNTITGLEALLRWSLPKRGMIRPATFIPLAEQTGLINPIGEWVLETACRQNKLWQDKVGAGLRMAVNISVCQLNNPDFVQQVENILKRTGLPPKDLELEITESATGKNIDAIAEVLSKLKAIGVFISIDDFGTEYSSLSRLKILPIDRVKMDMQFVHGIEGNEKDRAIAKIIINLAKNLNYKVVAEGVETENQLNFLRARMCDELQGYYLYKPMPPEEVEKILLLNYPK